MKSVRLKAPAKVNYRLDVLRRRADGYHDLRMIMQRIDICDDIIIKLKDTPGIEVSCGKQGVPDGPDNIAWQAANALLQRSALNVGIEISIMKNIPVAAGLGGGSSDAAAVLMGVNELLDLRLNDDQLMEIGGKLGADVPFFIFKSCALAEGVGDRLTRVAAIPDVWLVLVNPNIHVSTAWVYKNLQLTTNRDANIISLLYNNIEDICSVLGNDLESVTIRSFPIIGEIKQRLLAAGARGSLMSGSGPTVFGLFEDETRARQAAHELLCGNDWFVQAVRTL